MGLGIRNSEKLKFFIMDYNQLYVQFCDEFWKYFENSDRARGRKSATFLLWKDKSKPTRKAMAEFLSENGAPKDNPFFWVQHFPEPVPTNYNGKNMPDDKELFIAIYKDEAGIYTRQDVEDYEMTIKKRFEL